MTAQRYSNIPILTDVIGEARAAREAHEAPQAPDPGEPESELDVLAEANISLEEILPFEIGDDTAREARIEMARDAADELARGALHAQEADGGASTPATLQSFEDLSLLAAAAADEIDLVAAAALDDVELAAVETAAPADPLDRDVETLVAELQTLLASRVFTLTDELMGAAFSEMEAKLRQQISARLRTELPELIDSLLREHLGADREP